MFVILTVKWVTENIEIDCSSTIGLENSDFCSHQKKQISIHNKFVEFSPLQQCKDLVQSKILNSVWMAQYDCLYS